MKTSHYKTPRTMAECEFVVGYPIIEQEKTLSSGWVAIICIVLFLLVAWVTR